MIAAVHEMLVEIDVAALDEDEALLRRLAAHDLLLRDVGAPRDDAEPMQTVEHGGVRHVGDAHVIELARVGPEAGHPHVGRQQRHTVDELGVEGDRVEGIARAERLRRPHGDDRGLVTEPRVLQRRADGGQRVGRPVGGAVRLAEAEGHHLSLGELEIGEELLIDRLAVDRIEGARAIGGDDVLAVEHPGGAHVGEVEPPHPVELREREDGHADAAAHGQPVPGAQQQLDDALTGHEGRGQGYLERPTRPLPRHSEDDPTTLHATRPDRDALFLALGEEVFDLLVIGGGITGAGVARDAALRGLRVALVERARLRERNVEPVVAAGARRRAVPRAWASSDWCSSRAASGARCSASRRIWCARSPSPGRCTAARACRAGSWARDCSCTTCCRCSATGDTSAWTRARCTRASRRCAPRD